MQTRSVPYQAYRPKRHSRTVSAIPPNVPPPIPTAADSPPNDLPDTPTDDPAPPQPHPVPNGEPPDAEPRPSPSRSSTFRRLQPRSSVARPPHPSSPLRPPTTIVRQLDPSPPPSRSPPVHSRVPSVSSASLSSRPSPSHTPNPSALLPPTSLASSLAPSPITSPPLSSSPLPSRSPAPYRPGFQPKGVYRHRTDEFIHARKARHDVTRVERTKLERRLEKLIHLHFPIQPTDQPKKPSIDRRKSSLFDLDIATLKNMDPIDIWRGVVQSQDAKADIRAAEQRIAPWQEDTTVSKCPLCNASFHPLTNRKHHCRLCGKIICSLPIKRPQRSEPCSILFIVDLRTRLIEEVGEGVDYGVRKRSNGAGKGKEKEKEETLAEDEKFLKGVRICRNCKPILSREQFTQQVSRIPPLTRLYEAFIGLEKEIEDALPLFQELLLTLNSDSPPSKEAAAARKHILDDFASYDAISKRIRKIPCTPGSSQDRIQLAIRTRADLFLQKNMFPLQSLPKAKKQISSDDAAGPLVDPDSELAHALQPLLEQEALLESFVGEAMAHRKFEDAKTLKANLKEIRAEIDRIVENDAGTGAAQPVGVTA